jgi:hypothetical protein
MTRLPRAVVWLAAGVLLTPTRGQSLPPGVTPPEPPAPVAAALDKLRQRQDRPAAVAALAARDEAAPYLRLGLDDPDPAYRRDVAEALRAIDARIRERQAGRLPGWARGRRFDLCAEVLVDCPDRRTAEDLVGQLTTQLHAVGREVAERLGLPFGAQEGVLLPARFPTEDHRAGEVVTLPVTARGTGGIARAGWYEMAANEQWHWLVVCRDGVGYPTPGQTNEWIQSVVLCNGPCRVRAAFSTLVVCDGDVELGEYSILNSLIVANGDIRRDPAANADLSTRSVLAATGDVVFPRRTTLQSGYAYAGGVARPAGKPGPADRVRGHEPVLPFGVRFLDPAEFGLDLAAQNGGVQVMGIEPWSPFARYGVADGDVITAVDDAEPRTLPDFRRALRRGVIRESVVLTIRRGGQRLARVVYLDGIPSVAPPPRPAAK